MQLRDCKAAVSEHRTWVRWLSKARWAIENGGNSSSGKNRIKWIYYTDYGHTVWIKLSHWLVCHFSTELFCGRSANTKSRDLLFLTCTVAFYTHCIYIALYFTCEWKPNFSRLLMLLSLGWEAGYVHSWCRTIKTRNTLKHTAFIRISAQPWISAHLEYAPS